MNVFLLPTNKLSPLAQIIKYLKDVINKIDNGLVQVEKTHTRTGAKVVSIYTEESTTAKIFKIHNNNDVKRNAASFSFILNTTSI